jgi:ketosteroid isomerase-like protein
VSQENVETIRGVYARWSDGDFQGQRDLFDPLILFVIRPEFPNPGTYLGIERVAEYTRSLLEPWERLTIEAEEITEAGDTILAAVNQRGVGGGSGVSTGFRYFHLWSFRGTKVTRFESIRELADAREAAGL